MKFFVPLLFLLICFSGFAGTAQDSLKIEGQETNYASGSAPLPLHFDEKEIAFLKEQPAFNYFEKIEQENWWTQFKRYIRLKWQNFLNWLFSDYTPGPFLVFLLKLIPYLVIAGVLIFAVWLFAKLYPQRKLLEATAPGKVFFSEEEEIIQSRDISKLIEKAIAENNFRLAVRYYYLQILQQLTQKEIITYEFSKTDQDYLSEVKQENLKKQFEQLTRIYDFVWYGDFQPAPLYFKKAKREFALMEELILAKK